MNVIYFLRGDACDDELNAFVSNWIENVDVFGFMLNFICNVGQNISDPKWELKHLSLKIFVFYFFYEFSCLIIN